MRFCPNCGRSESETQLLADNFCLDCYRHLHPLLVLPNYLSLTVCPRCESFRVKKRWLGPISLRDAVSVGLQQRNALHTGVVLDVEEIELTPHVPEISVGLVARGQALEGLPEHSESHNLLLRLHWETCAECLDSRRKVMPYKLQLRSDMGLLSTRDRQIVDNALNEALYLHPSRFDRKDVEGGIDLEFENPRAVGEILDILRKKRMGEEHTSSEGVQRLPSGGQVTKKTYVFRFLSMEPGEIIHLSEGDVRIDRMMRGRAQITDLKTNKRSTLPIERLFDAKSSPIRE